MIKKIVKEVRKINFLCECKIIFIIIMTPPSPIFLQVREEEFYTTKKIDTTPYQT